MSRLLTPEVHEITGDIPVVARFEVPGRDDIRYADGTRSSSPDAKVGQLDER